MIANRHSAGLNVLAGHIAAIAHAYIANTGEIAPVSADGKRLSFGGISQAGVEVASA